MELLIEKTAREFMAWYSETTDDGEDRINICYIEIGGEFVLNDQLAEYVSYHTDITPKQLELDLLKVRAAYNKWVKERSERFNKINQIINCMQ